jgi:hypothetical protein
MKIKNMRIRVECYNFVIMTILSIIIFIIVWCYVILVRLVVNSDYCYYNLVRL